ISFSVKVETNSSLRASSSARNSSAPRNFVPSGSAPEGSIGVEPSAVRHLPMPSKLSSAKPSGSMRAWQAAHVGFLRCCSRPSRTGPGFARLAFSLGAGAFGGGGGGGAPSKFLRIHFPRFTGEVRVGYDVTVKMLAWPSSPPRRLSENVTRRKWLPYTFG